MRPVLSALLFLSLVGAAFGQTQSVELFQVLIDGDTVTVEYSKNFKTCAHLYNNQGQVTHSQNLFCETGEHIVAVNDLSDFMNLQVGDVVHLQHGNNSKVRSEDVTVTGPPAVALHRVEIDGDTVTVEYTKNFAACARLYHDSGEPAQVGDLFCVSGENLVSVHDLAEFTSLQAGDVVYLRHANDPDIRSEDVTVTAVEECPLEFALRQVQRLVPAQFKVDRRASLFRDDLLKVVRRFRDESLNRTPAGRRLIAVYYGHRGELTRILASRPEVAARSVALVFRASPAFESCDGPLTLDDDLYADGLALLDEFEARGSAQLRLALVQARTDIAAACGRQGDIAPHVRGGLSGRTQLVQGESQPRTRTTGSAAIVCCVAILAGIGAVPTGLRAAGFRTVRHTDH